MKVRKSKVLTHQQARPGIRFIFVKHPDSTGNAVPIEVQAQP